MVNASLGVTVSKVNILTTISLVPRRLDRPMIMQILGSIAKTQLSCKHIHIVIHGVKFWIDLILL
jgi:hypothetical protein